MSARLQNFLVQQVSLSVIGQVMGINGRIKGDLVGNGLFGKGNQRLVQGRSLWRRRPRNCSERYSFIFSSSGVAFKSTTPMYPHP